MSATTPGPVFDLLHRVAEHAEALELAGQLLGEYASERDRGRPEDVMLLQIASILSLHGRGLEQLVEELTTQEAERQPMPRKGRRR